MRIVPGMIVCAKAGRDQERFFVVVAVEDGRALIVDGKRRGAEHPKRKNPRHLSPTQTVVALSEAMTNPKLRRLLRPFNGDADAIR